MIEQFIEGLYKNIVEGNMNCLLYTSHIFETPFDKAPIPAPLPILPTIDNAGPATNVSPPVIAPPIAPPTACLLYTSRFQEQV